MDPEATSLASSQAEDGPPSSRSYSGPIASAAASANNGSFSGTKAYHVPRNIGKGQIKKNDFSSKSTFNKPQSRGDSPIFLPRDSDKKRPYNDTDKEDQEIVHLVHNKKLRFDQVTEKLNEERKAAGQEERLTMNAIYSRYILNVIRNANNHRKSPPPFDAAEDAKLLEAYQEIQDEMWARVSERLLLKGGHDRSALACRTRLGETRSDDSTSHANS